ncbi:MAG: adenine phosphoribosyltransferase [Kiritimatiellia bacterium]|nr:adenine phosphoribosyltransferase [Kiritimatiellia bacterium]
MSLETLRTAIRDIPDFPKPGIVFKDVTPILAKAAFFREAVDLFAERHRASRLDSIAAVEARGFLFGAALADRLGVGLIPVRKKGKLPYRTRSASYDLEYGSATLEIHEDAFSPGARVLLIDDLLATGGTLAAAVGLIEQLGATLVEIDVLVELAFLNGRARLAGRTVFAPIVF